MRWGSTTLGSARILRAGEGILPSRSSVEGSSTVGQPRIDAVPVQVRRRRMRRPARYKRALPTRMPNESRIDQLRDEAWAKGVVTGRGVDVAGGPIPRKPGYYGQPVVRPPVWTWEIPIYFFVGGLGGMSPVIALGRCYFITSMLRARQCGLLRLHRSCRQFS